MEEGGQISTHFVAFTVPLELDCNEAKAITQAEEREDTIVDEEEETADVTPYPVLSYAPDESADQQPALAEPRPVSNNEGDNLQHN